MACKTRSQVLVNVTGSVATPSALPRALSQCPSLLSLGDQGLSLLPSLLKSCPLHTQVSRPNSIWEAVVEGGAPWTENLETTVPMTTLFLPVGGSLDLGFPAVEGKEVICMFHPSLSSHPRGPMEVPAVGQVKGYAGLDIVSKSQVAQSPDASVQESDDGYSQRQDDWEVAGILHLVFQWQNL